MAAHTVALPSERFIQLKLLASIEGASLSDTISGFIDEAIGAGRLPDTLPGWNIKRLGENVLMAHAETGFAKLMPATGAQQVGDTLCKMSGAAKTRAAHLDIDAMIEIRRQGAGIVIRDADSFISYSAAVNVAADIGRRLLAAAGQSC